MASISFGEETIDIDDESIIQAHVESLGIPFSCKDGRCGTCLVNVLEGKDNLTDLNDKEKEFGLLDKNTRLACQCKIKSGNIKIESGY